MRELNLIDLVIIQDVELSKIAIAADKNIPYVTRSLGEYHDKQREYWKTSKNIVVFENEDNLRNFIRRAKNNEIVDSKMYFGKITKELAERIKKDTGLNINTEGYNLSISANEIRKIFKGHGKETAETMRGQRAITEDDIVNIPLIVANPDAIKLSDEMYRGKQVIVFIKTFNGRTTIISYVSPTPHDITVQTMYSGRKKPTPTA